MKNILAISYSDLGNWDGQTRNLTKLQGEGRMVRKMPTPQVRPSNYMHLRGGWQVPNVVLYGKRTSMSLKGIQKLYTHGFDDVRKTPATQQVIPWYCQ